MKTYKRCYTKKILVCVLLCLFLTGYSCRALAGDPFKETTRNIPDEEIPIILDLIATQTRDNYERIVAWSGGIDVKINWLWSEAKAKEIFEYTDGIRKTPEAILQKVEEKQDFAIDVDKNFVYIKKLREKQQYINHITEIDLGRRSTHNIQSTSIFKPDFCIESRPVSFKDNKIVRRKAVKKLSPQKEFRTELYEGIISDPRRIFMPGSIHVWEHHNILIDKINRYGKIEFDGYKFQIEEHNKDGITEYQVIEPSVVSLERSDPNHYIIVTKIFSSRYGFNMTYLEANSGGGVPIQKFTWEYELINGVYLPKSVTEKYYGSCGKVASEKDRTYINNKLNQEIPAETFEYTNLGLKDGDIFIDEILNKEYRYEAATKKLIPVEK